LSLNGVVVKKVETAQSKALACSHRTTRRNNPVSHEFYLSRRENLDSHQVKGLIFSNRYTNFL